MKTKIVLILTFFQCTFGYAAIPASRRSIPDSHEFMHSFHSEMYLSIAIELQSQSSADRFKHLEEIGRDPNHGSAVFTLCRMLYVPKPGNEFRGPYIGGPSFVGNVPRDEAKRRWPLEPIVIRDHMPILVVTSYALGGSLPELPLEYLQYCESNCVWRSEKFLMLTLLKRREIVRAFADSLGTLPKTERGSLLDQAEDQ